MIRVINVLLLPSFLPFGANHATNNKAGRLVS
jgi:hypothetical protein